MNPIRFAPVVLSLFLSACDSPAPAPFKPVADVKQLMASVVEPAADVYWESVGWVIDKQGVTEIAPKTSADWDAVRNSAFVIAESGNLLMMGPRATDGGDWMAMSRALIDAGQRALRAAEARDKAAVFDAGAEIYETCTNCHAKYWAASVRPSTRKE